MKRDEMLEIVSELLTVLYGKNVTLMEAESIAYMFNERVKKEIAAEGEHYQPGTDDSGFSAENQCVIPASCKTEGGGRWHPLK